MKNKKFAIIFFSILGMLSLVIAGCDNSAAEKQSNASTIDPAEKLEMLRKIEQLDKMDFQGELTRLNACLKKYDLSCADKHLKRAGMFMSDAEDKKQIAVAAASIGGTRFLAKARECINRDSFSCAKTNIEQAKSVNGNVVMATLLKNAESTYETSYGM